MKSLFIISVAILTSISMDAQKYLKVLDATAQSWAGGMPQSGSGTTYTIKAVLLTSHDIRYTDAWVGTEYTVPEVMSFSHSDGRQLTKGDTILIKIIMHHYPQDSPMQASLPAYKSPPIALRGEAMIRYVIGRSEKYLAIPKFKHLPPLNFP